MGRHAADIAEPVAEPGRHMTHEVHLAGAVLEADQVGAGLGKARDRVGIGDRIGAVVENDAEAGRIADGLHMGIDAFLRRFRQIVRQQENTVGTRLLHDLRRLDGKRRAVAATRNDRHLARYVLGRAGDLAHFVRRERKELAGAAGSEQGRGLKAGKPLHMTSVALQIELVVRREVRDRKGQEPRTDTRLDFFRRQ